MQDINVEKDRDVYNILTFDYYRSEIVSEHPFSWEWVGFLDVDFVPDNYYTRDGFGYSPDDLRFPNFHAGKILSKVRSMIGNNIPHDQIGEYMRQSELVLDFYYYVRCLITNPGVRTVQPVYLADIMFEYGLYSEMADAVADLYGLIIHSGQYNTLSPLKDLIYSLDDVLVAAGDVCLCYRRNLELAMDLYGLVKQGDYILSQIAGMGVSSRSAAYIASHYQMISDIYHGLKLTGSYDSKPLTDLSVTYNEYLTKESDYPFENDENACNASYWTFYWLDKFINYPSTTPDDKRIIIIAAYKGFWRFLRFVLYRLVDEKAEKSRFIKYRDGIADKLEYMKGMVPDVLINAIKNWPDNKDFSEASYYLNIEISASFIRDGLQVPPEDKRAKSDVGNAIAYYTTLNAFSYMLPDKCKGDRSDGLGHITMMNAAYMNDPSEGQLLRRMIYTADELQAVHTIDVPYIFIKCFTSETDFLPMWEIYGDRAEGICVILDSEEPFISNSTQDEQIYHVCYLDIQRDEPITVHDNPFLGKSRNSSEKEKNRTDYLKKLITGLIKNIKSPKGIESVNKSLLDSILQWYAYLFKDKSYSYEQELRILRVKSHFSSQMRYTNTTPPKLFMLTKCQANISKIIIGPKVLEPATVAAYIRSQFEIAGMDIPEIVRSEIEYR